MPSTQQVEGLPEGFTVGPPLQSQQVEGLPEGFTVGPSLQSSKTASEQPDKPPSAWQTLTQPTEKTDKEYLSQKGLSGIVGATVHGLNKVAEGTMGAVKAVPQGIMSDVEGGHVPLLHSMITEPAKQLIHGIPQIRGAVRDINASPDPLGHYADAAEETASQGAGQALAGIALAKLPEATPPLIRGAAKTYNAARKVGHYVAPVAGAVEAGAQLLKGNPQGAMYSAVTGGSLGHILHTLPEAPEAVTRFGLPKDAPLDATSDAGEPAPKKPSIGKISTGEPTAEPLIKTTAKAPTKGSPSQWLQENAAQSPDHAAVQAHVEDLPKEDFLKLAKARGIPADAYDTRETLREDGSKHSTGRAQIARQMDNSLSKEELENIQRTSKDIQNNPDQSRLSKAERAKQLFPELREAAPELKPQTPSMPRIGGTKVKAVSDLSKNTLEVMKSMQVSPEKVLDELEGTESQVRAQLLRASGEDIARWEGLDAHPVKLIHSPEGDTLEADGRHRVMQAIERGDKTVRVQTTMRDGTVQNLDVDPKVAAKKFGVTKGSLAETDAQQKAYGKR